MRAIIRFSIDNELNGSLRNKLKRRLQKAGFKLQRGTATYEHSGIDAADFADVLAKIWSAADKHEHVDGKPGRIDHFWLYSDRKPPPRNSSSPLLPKPQRTA